MKRTAALAACLCILAGCHKREEATNTAPPPATASTTSATSTASTPTQPAEAAQPQGGGPPPAPTLTQIPASATPNAAPDLNILTMRLRAWVRANGHWPKTFEEFAATSNMQIPPAPQGKKYAITSKGWVVLADK